MGRGLAWRVHSRPRRLSFSDIAAWSELTAMHIAPWQVAAIELLDKLMIDFIEGVAKGDPVATGRPVTRQNVKAFFDAFTTKKKG
jgi:hypothetical protein